MVRSGENEGDMLKNGGVANWVSSKSMLTSTESIKSCSFGAAPAG